MRTTWKGLAALTVGGCMLLGLAACGSSAGTNQQSGSAQAAYAEDTPAEQTGSAAQGSAEQTQQTTGSVSQESLKSIEPSVAALVSCMNNNQKTSITVSEEAADTSFSTDYVLAYCKQLSSQSAAHKELGDTNYDKYYQVDQEQLEDAVISGLGADASVPVDQNKIYQKDGIYYVADTTEPTVLVSYKKSDQSEDTAEHSYSYTITQEDGTTISGSVMVSVSSNDASSSKLSVDTITMSDEQKVSQPQTSTGTTADNNEDGEARNEVSMSEALEMVENEFGTQDAETGRSYDYELDSVEEIGGVQYYVYRMTWSVDEQDGGAKSKLLQYIFVATDGSTIHTGSGDDDGYTIDYSS